MKLITEVFEDNIETLVESNEAGGKTYKIKGVMMESGCVNRNKRFYTEAVLMKETKRYVSEYVQKKRALGELNHPPSPTVNLDRVAILIEVLSPKGKQVYGEAKVLSTPMGNIVQNLIKEGVKLGVSSRGMGSLENKNGVNYVKEDFTLAAIDVVADPSAPNAFVDGILEGKEWIWDNGLLKEVQINEYAKQLRKAPKRKLEENAIKLFSDFLRKL